MKWPSAYRVTNNCWICYIFYFKSTSVIFFLTFALYFHQNEINICAQEEQRVHVKPQAKSTSCPVLSKNNMTVFLVNYLRLRPGLRPDQRLADTFSTSPPGASSRSHFLWQTLIPVRRRGGISQRVLQVFPDQRRSSHLSAFLLVFLCNSDILSLSFLML